MEYICNMCDEHEAAYAWLTEGRGWKFICEGCYDFTSPIIQMYCEPFEAGRYYPTYDYVTRKVR